MRGPKRPHRFSLGTQVNAEPTRALAAAEFVETGTRRDPGLMATPATAALQTRQHVHYPVVFVRRSATRSPKAWFEALARPGGNVTGFTEFGCPLWERNG